MLTMQNQQKALKIIAFLGVSLLAAGCQDSSMSDLRRFVETTYQNEKPEIEPLPEIRPYEGFVYSAEELTDPFDTVNILPQTAEDEGGGPDSDRRREPLEAYALDGLQMVGTMERDGQPWAIIKAPDGTAQRVTLGNYMGQNNGKIIDISLDEQKVELVEVVRAPTGKWVNQTVFLSAGEE